MPIGLNQADIEATVSSELLALARYTFTAPGGRPIFTREQRDAIARAVSSVVARNNAEILRQLREAGVTGI